MNGQYKVGDVVLRKWTLTRLIGEGSYGKVFEAERNDIGGTFQAAVKIIVIPQSKDEITSAIAEGMTEESVSEYFKGFVENIAQEFALMSKLKGNSHIVSYEDHEVVPHEDGIGWDIIIRMELLTPLLDILKTEAITRKDVIKLGIDMCEALELCQKHHIIHRDIKPENIFRSDAGDYKLGDFGIARTIDKTMGGMSKKGTYTYMAPEVYKEQPYGSSADIYSLGIVMYRLLNNNRTPFLPEHPIPIKHADRENALSRRIRGEQIPMPANDHNRLAEIILKACAYNPKDRYTSPAEMREELEAILYELQTGSEEESEATIIPESFGSGTGTNSSSSYGSYSSAARSSESLSSQNRQQPSSENNSSSSQAGSTSDEKKVKKSPLFWIVPLIFALVVGAVFGVRLWTSDSAPTPTIAPSPMASAPVTEKPTIMPAPDKTTSTPAPDKTTPTPAPDKEETSAALSSENDEAFTSLASDKLHTHEWIEATCTEPRTCSLCGETEGEALDHQWSAPTYTWSEDNSSVTAKRECLRDSNHVEKETVITENKIAKQTTCEQNGETVYTAAFKNPAFSEQSRTVADILALGHEWGKPAYTWAEDNSSVTAERVCLHDGDHIEKETVETESRVTKPAACEENGETVYTAAFKNPVFTEQSKIAADIPALGHEWGNPTYTWAEDNSSVTAERVCIHDSSHAEKETVKTESRIAKQATCEENGETVYSTVAFKNPAFAEQSKTAADIPALGHEWKEATCTEPQTCIRCGKKNGKPLGHIWQEASCTEPQTCIRCGETNGEALGHVEITDPAVEPTCTEDGYTEGRHCAVCNEILQAQQIVNALGHSYEEATCTEPQTCSRCGAKRGLAAGHSWIRATCTEPKTCSVCGETEGEPLGHEWIPASHSSPKTCSRCGVTEGEPLPSPSPATVTQAQSQTSDPASTSAFTPTPTYVAAPTPTPVPEPAETPRILSQHEIDAITNIRYVQAGDYITFGSYEQNGVLSDGKEPIEWLVLDRDKKDSEKVLVVSRYGLASMPYNEKEGNITWRKASVRTWLNDNFLDTAFTEKEQQQIVLTHVEREKNPQYPDSSAGDSTDDKVFLLSATQIEEYLPSSLAKLCEPSKTTKAGGAWTSSVTGCSWWWVRVPGETGASAVVVSSGGSVYMEGAPADTTGYVVRPAMWIKLDGEAMSFTEMAEFGKNKSAAASVRAGDHLLFGNYEQRLTKSSGKEPIEWIVLTVDNGKAMLVSRYALDSQPFNSEYHGGEGIVWKTSSLRSWLNNDFYNAAFNDREKRSVLEMKNPADRNPQYKAVDPGNATTEKVFLLSSAEVAEYLTSSSSRCCLPTPYARSQGAAEYGYAWWWLRTPGYNSPYTATVSSRGTINYYGDFFDSDTYAVRPAIWMNLDEEVLFATENTGSVQISDNNYSVSVGSTLTLGYYEQDNNGDNGSEKIEWTVLDVQDGKALVISKYELDTLPFNQIAADEKVKEQYITWSASTLRSWMNKSFINVAFSADEQKVILQSRVSADKNPIYDHGEGASTRDKVFLLSVTEVNKYFSSDESRQCEATPYAQKKSPLISSQYKLNTSWWWLRTTGDTLYTAVCVDTNGKITYNGIRNYYTEYTVRPAMWIDLAAYRALG